jgi:hypothetical protein
MTDALLAPACAGKGPVEVEVWGKAAIGDYLWEHILDAPEPTLQSGKLWSKGKLTRGCLQLTFRKGWLVQTGALPHVAVDATQIKQLVLVLNAHEPGKLATVGRSGFYRRGIIDFAQEWLLDQAFDLCCARLRWAQQPSRRVIHWVHTLYVLDPLTPT